MAADKNEHGKQNRAEWLRRASLFALFSAVLLIPKTLALRRRSAVWNALRAAAGLAGIALVATSLAPVVDSTALLLGGLFLFLALGIPPQKISGSVDAKAHELGALVVLNGGVCRSPSGELVAVRIHVAPERLHVLDDKQRSVIEISVAEIGGVRVTGEGSQRTLVVEVKGRTTEFRYEGFFAEHLAEVSRRTVESRLRSHLRVLR